MAADNEIVLRFAEPPGGQPPGGSFSPERYRELQNRADLSQPLTEDERRELAALQRQVKEQAEALRGLIGQKPQPAVAAADKKKPQQVELTKENLDLVTKAMAGKVDPDEAAKRLGFTPSQQQPAPVPTQAQAAKAQNDKQVDANAKPPAFVGPAAPWQTSPAFVGATQQQPARARNVAEPPAEPKKAVPIAERVIDVDNGPRPNDYSRRMDAPGGRAGHWSGEVRDDAGRAERERAEQMGRMGQASQAAQTIALSRGTGGKAAGLAQLAGTGMLGSSAAALATGPVGAAVMAGGIIYDQVSELIRKPFQNARAAVDGFADAGKKLANNDVAGLYAQGTEAVAKGLESAGLAGIVAAEQFRTMTAGVRAATAVIDAFVQRGRELAKFSAPLAGATANADVARLTADIREAQVTGKNLSRLVTAQSEAEQTGREVLLLIKNEVIGILADILEPVGQIATEVRPLVKSFTEFNRASEPVRRLATGLLTGGGLQVLKLALRLMRYHPFFIAFGGAKEEQTLLDEVFAAADELLKPAPASPAASAKPPAKQAVGAPTIYDFPMPPGR